MHARIARHVAVVVAASLAATACDRTPTTAAPTAAAPLAVKAPKAASFTFAKVPTGLTDRSITSPSSGLSTLLVQMTAVRAAGIVVSELGFMVSGSLQAGDVGGYQLVYYPKGPSKPGVVVGTNDGSTWVAPGSSPASFIRFALAAPITIPSGSSFTAYFELRADVVGPAPFFFYASAQTCTVDDGTGAKDVTWFGGDLPARGDTFFVN